MKVRVRLFSIARDLAGFEEQELELPGNSTAADVLTHLNSLNARFADWQPSLRVAVNCEYVPASHLLTQGDEIAIIPPVSGG